MHRAAFITLSIWATFAQAFYPYIPIYACDEYHGCQDEDKRSMPAGELHQAASRDADVGDLLTFKLTQRSSPGDQDPATIAARQAERLRRKFRSKRVVSTLTRSEDPIKRANAFSVSTAETPSATNSVGIDQDGSDISYFVEAKLGSKADPVYLLCDTGAGSSWIMGSDCTSTACQDHTTWKASDSTTYEATGETFSIAYGTGSVSGTLAKDSISIASVELTMEFGVANITSDDFTHFAFDGILGLSMASGSTDNFVSTIKSEKILTSNVFGVNLNRHTDCLNTGELTFGGTDSSKFTGDITYTAVDSDAGGDWAIAMDDVAYNGTKAGITNRLAYIDTGTTYAFAPSADVVALHELIPGASSTDNVTYTAPCDSAQPIIITFSGVDREVSVKDWLSSPSSSGICTSNIYGREVVAGAWLLGDVFLKNVYTVFDADASRVGEWNAHGLTATRFLRY
ncbi:hypothetical protein N0V82_001906 [Gnomoniopsis sp. IMI 355080]|nr:hypothetical protein N0V82_001906 [Gnomoniopsis sp. IMI 355080]